MFTIFAVLLVAVLVWYAVAGRAWLKTKPAAEGFFAWIEPTEIALYRKSETLLMGRLLSVGGMLVTAYDAVAVSFAGLDITPLTTRLFDVLHIAQDLRSIATTVMITGIGLLISWLRKRTSKPIELVAVPDKLVTPKVAEAIAMADQTKDEAVSAVATVVKS